jgi:hypothetical protein
LKIIQFKHYNMIRIYTTTLVLLLSTVFATAQNPTQTARNFILQNTQQIKGDQLEFTVSSQYKPSKADYNYVYFTQKHQDIDIYNAVYNVVVDSKDNVIYNVHNFENNFEESEKIDFSKIISAKDALHRAFQSVDKSVSNLILVDETKNNSGVTVKTRFIDSSLPHDTMIAKLEWLPVNYVQFQPPVKSAMTLTWALAFEGKTNANHWLIHLHASSGQIVKKDDLVIHCSFGETPEQHANHTHKNSVSNSKENRTFAPNSYNVFDIPVESPIHGSRSIVTSPYNRFVTSGTGPGSTNGWHSDGYTDYTNTRGNNVWASEDRGANDVAGFSPNSPTLDFNYPFTHGLSTATANQSAAITNLFYWNNLLHDILYKYGFDEQSGNFQNHNMGRGGVGGDYVRADAQDGYSTDNANFYTPIDGGVPRMQMFLWSSNSVYQPDSDFDNGVIAHEYGHGWSTRLTGGPSTNTCLQNAEQGGEGWSDYLGLMLTTDWTNTTPTIASANIRRSIGNYVKTQPVTGPGIRPYAYSYDMANVNPTVTYGQVANSSFSQPHGIGSIWATILWDMTWEIILQDGEVEDNIWNTDNMVGNVAALKLVHEGLRLQPCSPSFVDARNAILMADIIYFGGRYRCSIDKAFARRGLGENASTGKSSSDREVFEDFSLLTGPKLTSPTQLTACSNVAFNYTATSSASGSTFLWTRAAVSGISNPASNGTSPNISETLTNTTTSNIDVTYKIYISPTACGFPPHGYVVKVTVKPTVTPAVNEYKICQGATVPAGQGLMGIGTETIVANSLNVSVALNSSSPTFTRYPNSSGTYYYQVNPFTANITGTYVINLTRSSGDPYLNVYSNFNPANSAVNVLGYNDDGGGDLNSRLTINLTSGQTIYIVSTTYSNLETGNFNLTVNSTSSGPSVQHYWYKDAITTTALSNNNVFNPVGLSGSGIPNTSSPGTYTFYYSTDPEKLCRVPVQFTIDSASVGGTITDIGAICPGQSASALLTGSVGTIQYWETSTNDFATSTVIFTTANPLNVSGFAENTKVRAVVKSGVCPIANSSSVSLNYIPVNLNITTDYLSETKTDRASERITGNNKITSPANIIYRAGKSVELLPGFEAANASVFLAEIGGCN